MTNPGLLRDIADDRPRVAEAGVTSHSIAGRSADRYLVRYVVPAIVVLSVLWMVATLRPGHSWYDDFAQYVMQAVNTADLRPFDTTPYLYDPVSPVVGPRLYPPVFPLALAPVVDYAGVDLVLMKRICVVFFSAGLIITLLLFRTTLNDRELAVYAVLIGFSPVFWDMKEYIYSEHLFVPLFYASILLMDRWYSSGRVFVSPVLHGVCLGLLIYLTYGTRTIGIVLFPALALCEIVRIFGAANGRRSSLVPSSIGMTALAVGGALVLAQSALMPAAGSGYFDQLKALTSGDVLHNLHANTTSLSLLWENGRDEWLRRIGGGLFMLIGGVGFLRGNWPRPSALGIAFAGYFVVVLLWPGAAWIRLVWPILPAFALYVLLGTRYLSESWGRQLPAVALLVFTLVSQGLYYSGADYGPIADSIDSPESKELYAFVQANTAPYDVILFWKPRGLALYTGRTVSKLPTRSPELILSRGKDIGASLIVVRNGADARETAFTRRIDGLHQVFANDAYIAYRFDPQVASIRAAIR